MTYHLRCLSDFPRHQKNLHLSGTRTKLFGRFYFCLFASTVLAVSSDFLFACGRAGYFLRSLGSRGDGDVIFTNPSLPTTGQGKRKMSHILKRTSTHENRKMGKSKPSCGVQGDGDKVGLCRTGGTGQGIEKGREELYSPLSWVWFLGDSAAAMSFTATSWRVLPT